MNDTIRGGWGISTEHDGAYGYHWWASRNGVLWAKGWMRTEIEAHAEMQALIAGRTARDCSQGAVVA